MKVWLLRLHMNETMCGIRNSGQETYVLDGHLWMWRVSILLIETSCSYCFGWISDEMKASWSAWHFRSQRINLVIKKQQQQQHKTSLWWHVVSNWLRWNKLTFSKTPVLKIQMIQVYNVPQKRVQETGWKFFIKTSWAM